jgi:hypothetical protein
MHLNADGGAVLNVRRREAFGRAMRRQVIFQSAADKRRVASVYPDPEREASD